MNHDCRRLFLVCSIAALMIPSMARSQTGNGYVGIYSDSLGTQPCGSVETYTSATLYVFANVVGATASGITGAEFRVEVSAPSGWIISYSPPGHASLVLGNPIDIDSTGASGGVNVVFSECQVPSANGKVPLGTISAFNLAGSATNLYVKRHSNPTNHGYQCPLFTRCDAPTYSKSCMTSSSEPACSLSTSKPKNAIASDPIIFVAILNGEESGTGAEQRIPERQVVGMFGPGVIQLPSGSVGASIQSSTIGSPAVLAALQANTVERIEKAFPNFTLADTVATARTGEIVRMTNLADIYVLRVSVGGVPATLAADLSSLEDDVIFAEVDGTAHFDGSRFHSSTSVAGMACPDDPKFAQQWSLANALDTDIDACEAWAVTTGTTNTRIAVIDTGVDGGHEDLAGKVSAHVGFGDSSPGAGDAHHGTHVAGIAAAVSNNGLGIAGVDQNAQIVARRIDGNPDTSEISTNIREAVQNNQAQITNNSWHTDNSNNIRLAFRDIYMLNALSIAAMGNDAGSQVFYPAGYPTILAVGATDSEDRIAPWSNTGDHIDVVAPGDDILSTVPATLFPAKYIIEEGTSMAAPHVAGIAGLLLSYGNLIGRTLYNDDLEQLIRLGVDDSPFDPTPGIEDPVYGTGRVNADKTLSLLRSPYELRHENIAGGGTIVGSTGGFDNTRFYNPPPGFAVGNYLAKRHEVHRAVTFSIPYDSTPSVWGRGVATNSGGWNSENPNYGEGFCQPVAGTITPTGCTLRTFVYEVRSYPLGTPVGWWPTTPANISLAYSVHGEITTSDVDENDEIQVGTQISFLSPNPLTPGSTIVLAMPHEGRVKLEVFNVGGRRVISVHDGVLRAGRHVLSWSGVDDRGTPLASGLYFARLQSETRELKRKLVVLQ